VLVAMQVTLELTSLPRLPGTGIASYQCVVGLLHHSATATVVADNRLVCHLPLSSLSVVHHDTGTHTHTHTTRHSFSFIKVVDRPLQP